MILLNEYQTRASGTAVYPGRLSPHGLMYAALKLNGEAGELAEHVYKAHYQAAFLPEEIDAIIKEVGDVAWYCAALCDELECTLHFACGTELTNERGGQSRRLATMQDLALRLNAEAGKLAEQVGKAMRDDAYGMPENYVAGALRVGEPGNGNPPSDILTSARRAKIIEQVRLVMFTLDDITDKLKTNFPYALELNLKKLADRQARGVLQGSGDNR